MVELALLNDQRFLLGLVHFLRVIVYFIVYSVTAIVKIMTIQALIVTFSFFIKVDCLKFFLQV